MRCVAEVIRPVRRASSPPTTQRQALSLYRSCLRAARAKGPDAAPALEAHARQEFEKYRRLEKREIQVRAGPTNARAAHPVHAALTRGALPPRAQLIEHHLRRGSKQLELMRRPEFASVTVTAPPTR